MIGMRFDNREISSGVAEICAYGTAVRVEVAPATIPVVPVLTVTPIELVA